MPYTFGLSNTDSVSATFNAAYFGGNTSTLCAGWFYPTTLTNGRRLWSTGSGGNNNSLEIANTTDLRWRNSLNTTRSDYAISGIPLTTNTWWFIALYTVRSTTAESIAVWQATSEIPPTRMTVTTTIAGSGTAFTNLVTFVIGNEGGTQPFQGDIGWVTVFNQPTPAVEGPLLTTSTPSVTNAEADYIERSIVTKLWNGTADMQTGSLGVTQPVFGTHIPMDDFNNPATPSLIGPVRQKSTQGFAVFTINGSATRTEARPPSIIPWGQFNRYTRTAAR